MTSPVALVGLTYAGTDLQQSDLQWFFEITRGIVEVPSVRGRDSVVPGAAGRTERNRKNDVLSIVLTGFITADPTLTDLEDRRASYRQNVDAIRNLFAPSAARATLVAVMEDGTTQSIEARPLNIVGGTYIASEYRVLSVELEGYDDWLPGGS